MLITDFDFLKFCLCFFCKEFCYFPRAKWPLLNVVFPTGMSSGYFCMWTLVIISPIVPSPAMPVLFVALIVPDVLEF